MSNSLRAFFLSLTILSILLVSAFGTTSVAYADDGAPPEATETTTSSGEEESPPQETEQTPPPEATEETASPEATEETATPEPTEEAATPESTEETATPEPTEDTATPEAAEDGEAAEAEEPILEQLPDNTTITVLNEDGEAQPLATQSTADAIDSAYDPIWCPEGQSPTPGANGCTDSFDSFDDLLTYLEANQDNPDFQQAGTIFIQEGQYLGGESSVDFNNYQLTNTQNYNLTLQGGWDPSDNSVDPADTTDFVGVPLTIGSNTNPWAGSLTLVNLTFSNISGQTGITLYSDADITLTNVDVTTSLNGAELDASGDVTITDSSFNQNKKKGAGINAGGNVEITNTTFNKNGSMAGNTGKGLEVSSGANVTLSNVEASNNQVFGANISASGVVSITDGFFTGNKSFTFLYGKKNYNGGYGLQVVTTDDIVLDGVNASNNFFFGAHLEGADVDVSSSQFNMNGSGYENYPTGYGLEINSTGAVNLEEVEANNNQWFGADIEAVGDVLVADSMFNGNKSYKIYMKGAKGYHGYGLKVVTGGIIVLDNVATLNNNLFGADLTGSDVIVDTGNFSNNGTGQIGTGLVGKGLQINSTGAVTLANVTANNNQVFGADIVADGNVSVVDSFFSGNTTYKYNCKNKGKVAQGGGYGLKVVSAGSVALDTVEAENNYLYGAHLEGSIVTIDTAKFNNNGSGKEDRPTGFGVEVISEGRVTLAGVEANNNQYFGADVQAGDTITISNSFFSNNHAAAFDPTGHMMFYYGYGLTATTPGQIVMDGVEANFNNLWGASLTGGNVNIANSKFNNNVTDTMRFIDDTGLLVQSTGTVSLDHVEANDNRLFGATIHAAEDVFISESSFSGTNGITCQDRDCKVLVYDGVGLDVVAGGIIDLNGVTANDNTVTGAHLEGSNIFITNSTFNDTGSDNPKQPTGRGLEVISSGEVMLIGVEANDNELFGAAIEAVGAVTVSDSVFSGNMSYIGGYHEYSFLGFGLLVLSTGPVTLDNVTANDNNLFGAGLNGSQVDVSNSSFNNNGSGSVHTPTGEGLKIHSTGTVSLVNVETLDNELVGTNIVADGDVTVTDSFFSGSSADGADGLKISSSGNVTLNNVTADGNAGDGVDVHGACTSTLTVNGGTFTDNGRYGIRTQIPYSQTGSPTFSNNGSGNVFQGTSCFTTTASQNAESAGMPWWLWWWMKWDGQQAKGK